MKKSILALVFIVAASALCAQENPTLSAKVCRYNLVKRELPVDSIEQIVLTAKQVRKGKFVLVYKNATGDSDVKRSFVLEDNTGKQVFTSEGSSFKVKTKKLRELLQASPLKVTSMAIPSDPEKAKIVRVRPITVAEITLVP